ncbi:MAG: hypothetical protein ABEI86_09945, partial [Halobacteriaceae archaeon]
MHDVAHTLPMYNFAGGAVLRRLIRQIEKKGCRNASAVSVVSSPMKRLLMDDWGISEEKIS